MNQENITRTLATGQSDITRNEAYTKALGLNWTNANAPKYVVADKINGYEYVDLGLPSGTLWAKCNVGAKRETDGGLYFAWGETQGYTASQIPSEWLFTFSNYKWNEEKGLTTEISKYNSNDGKTKLDLEDDAAHVNMGEDWHMPTKEQCEELLNTEYVTSEWIENYNDSGINGRLFTSVSNGNTLFIPAVGLYFNSPYSDLSGTIFFIWSSTLYSQDVKKAWRFNSGNSGAVVSNDFRVSGLTVRGVVGEIENLSM